MIASKLATFLFNLIKKIIQTDKLFIWLGFLAVLPLFFISFFNNPGSDDFNFSYESQVEPFWSVQIGRYMDWSGRYFSNGLISFDPLTYNNYYLFKIVPIILLLLFIYSLYVFISCLQLNITKIKKWAIIGFFLFIYIYQMPSVCEGFYWIPGSITYQLPEILALFFYSLVVRYFQSKNIIYLLLSTIVLFATMGCNEITVVILLLFNLLLLLGNYYLFKKLSKPLFFIFILTVIFAGIEILAPGNSVRASYFIIKHQFIYSILKSVQVSFLFITMWTPIITLCCLFFTEDLIQLINEKINKKYICNPVFSLILVFIIVYAGTFPGVWSMNSKPPDRTVNTIYFFFIFGYLYFIITLIHYFINIKKINFVYQNKIKIIIGIIIILNFVSYNNIVLAYYDLLSGKAYKYNKEMIARFELIKKCNQPDCIVPELINKPPTIYNTVDMGLTTDKNNWKNMEMSRYFRKESIVIQPNDSIISE
ncbi:MAG TPA: DUF6056 family protein [Flavobacterium sp.]